MRNAKIKLHTAGIRPKLPIPRVIAGKKAADFNRTTPKSCGRSVSVASTVAPDSLAAAVVSKSGNP